MKTIKILATGLFLFAFSITLSGQTMKHLKNVNWKLNEQYVDSLLIDNDEDLYLFLDDNGSFMSDTLILEPASPQFQQRMTIGDSYNLQNVSIYGQNATSSLEMTVDGETKKWDILYEDAFNLVLFKYDTIPGYATESGQPIIYPNEMRLIRSIQ
ncbi:MAG: hypothetical protein AAFQ94_16240 [Bacteroidota bacterium]